MDVRVRCLLFLVCFLATSCGLASATVDADGSGTSQDSDSECPVCIRVIRAARELGKSRQEDAARMLTSYCQLTEQLQVEDQKFCYNIDNVRGELSRMLNLGADEFRVCRRVKAMNPDFCRVMAKKTNKEGIHKNDRLIRGVIYE